MGLLSNKKEIPEVTKELYIETLQKLVSNKILIEVYTCKCDMLDEMLKLKKTNYNIQYLDELVNYIPSYVAAIDTEEELNKMLKRPDKEFVNIYKQRYGIE